MLFLYEGQGTLTLESRAIAVREGSTCVIGRMYVRHQLDNEAAWAMKVLIVAFLPGIEEGWLAIGKPRRWGECAAAALSAGRDPKPSPDSRGRRVRPS
jgi:hypothetical protein